jgi:hypothetical protein
MITGAFCETRCALVEKGKLAKCPRDFVPHRAAPARAMRRRRDADSVLWLPRPRASSFETALSATMMPVTLRCGCGWQALVAELAAASFSELQRPPEPFAAAGLTVRIRFPPAVSHERTGPGG